MKNEILKDQADNLTNTCEQLAALIWLFSAQYTSDNASGILEAIKANPTAYSYLFSMIEDKALEVKALAGDLSELAYSKENA